MRAMKYHEEQGSFTVCTRASRVTWMLCLAAVMMMAMFLFTPVSYAKVAAGISGIVTDASGAVVPGVTVQVKSVETGIVTTRKTNGDGFYQFVDLQPGHYDLEVQQPGFSAFRQTAVALDVDSAKVINIKLSVGSASEKVEVSSDAIQ